MRNHRTDSPKNIRTLSGLTITLLAILLMPLALFSQGGADEPLQPLSVGDSEQANTAASGEARTATIAGLEVHSLPPGRSLVLRFDNSDDLSGFETLFARVNEDTYRRIPENLIRLRSDGLYVVNYYGVDRAGNRSTPRNRKFMIDSTAPELRGSVVNSVVTRKGAVGADAKFVISARDSGVGLKSVQWRPGRDGEWRDYTGPIALAELSGTGQRIIEYRATDRIENQTNSSIFNYTIDTTPPAIPAILDENAAPPILLRRGSLVVPPLEEASRLEYKLDDGSYAPLRAGETIPLPESGEYDISFRVTDELGNSQEKTYRIKVDTTPPVTEIRAVE